MKFDTTFRGRNEVQKNKWRPHYQTEFDGEPEKKTFCDLDRELLFLTKYRFKKKRLLIRNLIGDHFYEDANG